MLKSNAYSRYGIALTWPSPALYHLGIPRQNPVGTRNRLLTLIHEVKRMRRLIAYGLALFLGVASLGAAHRLRCRIDEGAVAADRDARGSEER